MTTFLVVGGDGLLGGAMASHLASRGDTVIATTRRHRLVGPQRPYLDLGDPAALSASLPRADVAFMCAAVTSLEACRRDPARTRAINVDATMAVAERMAAHGCFVVFISSDQVFSGDSQYPAEGKQTSPRTEYGRQKVAAEGALQATCPELAIVRLTKVISAQMSRLVEWASMLRAAQEVEAFVDLPVSPISLSFAIEVLGAVAARRITGILHASGDRDVSYYEIALEIARSVSAAQWLVVGARARNAYPPLEHVPRYSALGTRRLQEVLGIEPLDVLSAIRSAASDAAGVSIR